MIDPWVWAVMLLVVAIGLAVLELFVPSYGVLAFLSIASMIASLILAFRSGPVIGLIFLVAVIIGLPTGVGLAVKWWPHTPIGRRILLRGNDEEVRLDDDYHRRLKDLIGQTGEARSKMLPSGAVSVGGRTIDAYTEGVPIEPGQRVIVIDVHGTHVLVRPLEDDESPPSDEDEEGLSQPIDSIAPDPFGDTTA